MKNIMFCCLAQKYMFLKGSCIHNIIWSCNGDGYRALKCLLYNSHLVFYDEPTRMVKTYPRQQDCSMLDLSTILDYQQLQAFIKNDNKSLDDKMRWISSSIIQNILISYTE